MSGFFNRQEGYGLFDNILLCLIRKYPELVDWYAIQENSNANLYFLEKYKNKMAFSRCLSVNPNLTLNFIKENIEDMDFEDILANPCLDFEKEEVFEFIKAFEKHGLSEGEESSESEENSEHENWSIIARNPS